MAMLHVESAPSMPVWEAREICSGSTYLGHLDQAPLRFCLNSMLINTLQLLQNHQFLNENSKNYRGALQPEAILRRASGRGESGMKTACF